MTTTWLPSSIPAAVTTNGALWEIGPVTRTHPSGRMRIRPPSPPTFSNRAGAVVAISFGRPVLPPLVTSFHTGDTPGVNEPAGSCPGHRFQGRPRPRLGLRHPHHQRRIWPGPRWRSASRRREPVGDRLRHGAERPGREHALHEPGRVGQADGDRRALRHPAVREQRGQALNPLHELGPGQRHLSARQRRPVRIGFSKSAENGEKGSPLHVDRTYTGLAQPTRPHANGRHAISASGAEG